jgi:glycosyl transferase, family 25
MAPVFPINLDRDTDRLEHMRRQFKVIGQPFHRIPGVLGRQLPDRIRDQFPPSDLAEGLVGNYASHLVAAQRLLDSQSEAAIVVEDDLNLDVDRFVPVVTTALARAPQGWDVINILSVSGRAMLKITDLGNGSVLVRSSRHPWDCAGYVISRSGATKLLKWRPRTKGMDFEMRHPWHLGLDTFGIFPPLSSYAPFDSSVDAISTARRPVPRAQTGIDGALWYWRTLGTAGILKCTASNVLASIKRRMGHPKSYVRIVE